MGRRTQPLTRIKQLTWSDTKTAGSIFRSYFQHLKKVRVNSVNPGVIVTELQKTGGLDDEKYAKFLEHSKTTHALGRVGQPEEVAKAICFLASDDATFSTGVCLPVDGGRHAMCPR